MRPEDYYRVAQEFRDGQNAVMQTYRTLDNRLRELTGAAGHDEPAQKFDASYTPAVRAIFSGFVRLHELLGGIARGLAESAENHRRADAESAGSDPGGGFPPLWPDTCPAAAEPPAVLGDGDTNLLATISDWVVPYYPSGDVARMHELAAAFAATREGVQAIADDLHAQLLSLAANNVAEDLDALEEFWQRVAVKDSALLTSLPAACAAVANSCGDYASAVEHTRDKIGDIVEETSLELAAATGVGFIASLLTAPLGGTAIGGSAGAVVIDSATARLAAVAADFVIAISGAVTTVAAAEAGAALPMAINNTPDPDTTQTEATSVGNSTGGGQSQLPELKAERGQLEKEYKHVADFGVTEPRGAEGFKKFDEALQDFVKSPTTESKVGTYHGEPAILYFDRQTGLAVVQKPSGEFWTGWRLSEGQLNDVITRGKLGGG
ncbi:colicin D domain-containing protein [Saccharopolyspora thermophila]|uniref:colicin D domain-containing protein n=1 Tax=Saccharopolyspora thermophila TaxID=89367 RepID=UPI0031F885CE